jgi:hypothetical protein
MTRSKLFDAALVAVVLVGGCAANEESKPDTRDRSLPGPTASAGEMIVYITSRKGSSDGAIVRGGVELRSAHDVDKLQGAPEDFKNFIARDLAKSAASSEKFLVGQHTTAKEYGCDELVGATIWGVTSDVATGSEWACGEDGSDVIWTKRNRTWRLASSTTIGAWPCSELRRNRVPPQITVAKCVSSTKTWATEPYESPRG